ncbi:MAG: DNA-binding protein [Candidatus Devosia phytovorans]|uniref:DNA-binding protein n=1 Tax=Candidatus Devosia phytovorans TaxID=3121372 RepID=A0AAJ6AZA0_9HYPH|nr:DNA-binding protein [Devosia sp.]WEK03892.1 MAG: DNA-binding protein [Devosia sp.]
MLDSVIEDAFEELAASGAIPSVRQVRAKIGSGSMTQISNVVARLRSDFVLRNSPRHEVPDAMREQCERLTSKMWSFLKAEADAQVEEAKKSSELRVEEMGAALAEAYADADVMQKRIDELESARAELATRLSAEIAAGNAVKLDLAVSRQRFSDLSDQAKILQGLADSLARKKPDATSEGALVFGRDGPLRTTTVEAVGKLLRDHIAEHGEIVREHIAQTVEGLADAPRKRLETAVEKLIEAGTLVHDESGGTLALPAQQEVAPDAVDDQI